MSALSTNLFQKPTDRGWRLGLTGGMGVGKSTALTMLQECGWHVLQADLIARKILNEDAAVREALLDKWGSAVFSADGSVDRAFVGSRVFGNPDSLAWLEGQLHPRVRAHWSEIFAQAGQRNVIIEIPLLFEKDLHVFFDATICITVSRELQFTRLSKRGVDRETAAMRMAKQLPSDEKNMRADIVISNEGSEAFLREQVSYLI